MGLEEAITDIKAVFSLWKPWTLKRRNRALASLECITERYRNDAAALNFICHAVEIGTLNQKWGWECNLDFIFTRLEQYDAIDPAILGVFGTFVNTNLLYSTNPLKSYILPELLQSYKRELERDAMLGLVEGLSIEYYTEQEHSLSPFNGLVFREDNLKRFQKREVKSVLGYLKKFFEPYVLRQISKGTATLAPFDTYYNFTSTMSKYLSLEDSGKVHIVMREVFLFIGEHGFIPAPYLVAELCAARTDGKEDEEIIKEWNKTLASFAQGNFDPTNELHRNLEYTRFRQFVDHEKVKKYIKNQFTYEEFERIFAHSSAQEQPLSDQDAFEVACVAYEAKKLYDFILQVKEQADKQGRNVVVAPNFSYGYLPVAPLVHHLEAEGIEVLMGCKVGSTELHNNKEVINSRLFKGHRRNFMKKQPVIIVVDGTQHIVDRGTENTAARYPDAYQGYLNHVIAINDAKGLKDEDYSTRGKTEEDMKKLRASEEFQKAVAVYKELVPDTEQEPYQFALWNTAEIPLIIRNYHERIVEIMPATPEQIYGPAMIFCNASVPDNQIPQELKQQCPRLIHTPAYYDDSGRIIAFDYGFDNFGVRYLNRLETKVKEAFEMQHGKQEISLNVASAIMQYLSRAKTTVVEEMCI